MWAFGAFKLISCLSQTVSEIAFWLAALATEVGFSWLSCFQALLFYGGSNPLISCRVRTLVLQRELLYRLYCFFHTKPHISQSQDLVQNNIQLDYCFSVSSQCLKDGQNSLPSSLQ